MNGPSLFGGSDDKYVVFAGNRILVINNRGEVWAHDISSSQPSSFCGDTLGNGHKLNGPGLFGAPDDRYVVYSGGRLLVINAAGQVWARNLSGNSIGSGYKLAGPGLFGGPDHRYVVTYDVTPRLR